MTIANPVSPAIAFSAKVQLTLHIHGQEFELAEAGPDEIVLRRAQNIPPGLAKIITTIDNQSQVRRVHLAGQSNDRRTIRLRAQ